KLEGRTRVTSEGATVGTVAYMSPEQAQGKEVDHRTDIWSLGAVLFEMLTGRLPFASEHQMAALYAILNETPDSVADVRPDAPPGLDGIVKRALAKDNDERYQSATDLLNDLKKTQDALAGVSSSESTIRTRVVMGLFAAVYLLLTYVVVQWGARILTELELSPHLAELGGWALLLLFPTAVITAWTFIARQRLKLGRWRRVLIPANILAMAVVVLVLFHDKELGALTTTVTVEGEDGQAIERVVPKAEFIRHVAIFFFSNECDDPDLQYLSFAIPELLSDDLMQDMYMETYGGPVSIAARMVQAGHDPLDNPSEALLRGFSQRLNADSYLVGTFDRSDSLWSLSVSIHDTRSGRLSSEHTVEGDDIFALIDEQSIQIRHALDIPGPHIEREIDLQVSQTHTSSLEALRHYANACVALFVVGESDDAPGGLTTEIESDEVMSHIERAIDEDPEFCLAYMVQAVVQMRKGRTIAAQQSSENALKRDYRLSERMRFAARALHFGINGDQEAVLRLAKTWSELYPLDVKPFELSSTMHVIRGESDQAITALEEALSRDPTRTSLLLSLGEQCRLAEDNDAAERHFEKYVELLPRDERGPLNLGSLYASTGRFEQALEEYEKARMLRPQGVSICIAVADLKDKTGDFEGARDDLKSALESELTGWERFSLYTQLLGHYRLRGKVHDAIGLKGDWGKSAREVQSLYMTLGLDERLAFLVNIHTYSWLKIEAKSIKPDAVTDLENTQEQIQSVSVMDAESLHLPIAGYLLSLGRSDEASVRLDDFESSSFYLATGSTFTPILQYFRGLVAEAREDFAGAVASHRASLEVDSSDQSVAAALARALRLLERFDEANATLHDAIERFPSHPAVHYEMAMLHRQTGNFEKARYHVEQALRAWDQADENFVPAVEAKVLHDELASN
ncbi:MAG: tetratricopeptide repeat protein, partial [Candidatus Latescibacterota bacterium]